MKQEEFNILSRDGYEIPAVLHHPQQEDRVLGNVVLLHGIFTNKDESGRFVRQADFLVRNGFRVFRFDFRGHGKHPMKSGEITISGMIIDLKSVLEYIAAKYRERILVSASSFGASVLLLYLQTNSKIKPEKMVLLNPVVDYKLTFLKPTTSETKKIFSESVFRELDRQGYIVPIEGFHISEEMIIEMELFRPYKAFYSLTIPTRVIHGNKDTSVPYEITMAHALQSDYVDFRIIEGADHAFIPKEYENQSFLLILEWLKGS